MSSLGSMQGESAARARGVVSGGTHAVTAAFGWRTVASVLAGAACYYFATMIAWAMTFPDSKVSLFFPPHAILVSILLLVPYRRWWAYALAAASIHFFATQQAHWPPLYALQCEVFDVAKAALTAAGIRAFTTSPFHRINLREAINFVLVAVVIVPFGAALWGAAFTLSYGFGSHYWIEWRNLGVSNGVTVIVLVPAIMIGFNSLRGARFNTSPARVAETLLLAAGIYAVGYLAFDREAAGPDTSPALLYSPIPLLIWAVLRFGLGGMCTSMLAVTMMAIWGTMHGRGPFLSQAPEQNALALQLFVLVVSTPLLLLAAAIVDDRRSREALEASEARMGMTAESAQLVLWDWDIGADRVWFTESGRQLLGLAEGDSVDHATLSGRVHPEDRALRAAAIERALAGGDYESEFRLVLPDASVRWITARGRGQGKSTSGHVLGVSMDITRQKQAAEEAQVQRRELAHLARVATVSNLSGSLAHELSQPLTSILSNAQAGLRFIDRDPPEIGEVRDILRNIVGANERAGEIIHRLRNLLSRGEVSLQPVDVPEALAELLRLARSDLLARGVRVDTPKLAGLPQASTDRVQLQQVLLNLLFNACDAMAGNPPGQRVIEIGMNAVGGELRIDVLDRGSGLPEDTEVVFQPFHTTKEDGLGMGLAICRTLVTAHRGRLWCEHREGGGAAFHIALPLATGDGG
jgi:signal transduction histidine kinase